MAERRRMRRPATTAEEEEQQLIALANEVARKQMENNTASAQVITHFLKAGSGREQIERERLQREVSLLEAKVVSLASTANIEELIDTAIEAMRDYSPTMDQPPEEYQ